MDGVSVGDLIQFGVAAPFCWLYWQTEKANRAEREANRQTQEKIAAAVMVLAMRITGTPLSIEGSDHVQP